MNKLKTHEPIASAAAEVETHDIVFDVATDTEEVPPTTNTPEPTIDTLADKKVKVKTKSREFDRMVRGEESSASEPTKVTVGFDGFDGKSEKGVLFLSRYRISSFYVPKLFIDDDGDIVHKLDRYGDPEFELIRFQDGMYEARNPLVIKALREHDAFNKGFFEGEYPKWLSDIFDRDEEYIRRDRGAYEQGSIEI